MLSRVLAALAALALVLTASPAVAQEAAPPEPITVPVFGTSLVITIDVDDTGAFTGASVTAPDGWTSDDELEEDGGVELDITGPAGEMLEIEIGPDGSITEIEGYHPDAIAGSRVWTGNPIPGYGGVTITYDVMVDEVTGCPSIVVHEPPALLDDPLAPNGSVKFGGVSYTEHVEEGECEYRAQVAFYNGDWDGVSDAIWGDVFISAESEHGEWELEIEVRGPGGEGEHEDEDHDDDHDEDHDDDDDDDDDDDEEDEDDEDEDHD